MDKLRILPTVRERKVVVLGPLYNIWLNEEYLKDTR